MSNYGFPPKPTIIRKAEGNTAHRPFNRFEPQYREGVPERPTNLGPGARRVWDSLVREMAPTGVLRTVDGLALAHLCEDQALLDELRDGLRKMATEIRKKARMEKKKLPGGPMTAIARTTEGKRVLSSISELSRQVITQRREFGLTPASNTRVEAQGGVSSGIDAQERALCG